MHDKQSKLSRLLVALLALLPLTASADTERLASWTFSSGYDAVDNVYTPNNGEWKQVGWNGFAALPKILPNECVGTVTDYYVSAKGTRYWGIMDNNGDKIMSLYQDKDPNAITDYTDGSQHNQYIEVGFSTKGYKNVQFSFAFTCGDNNARSMEMVVSTDGGQTWFDAGSYAGAANWWIYNTSTVDLTANNKDLVIVRLIAPNDATAQWRFNEISITAEKAGEVQPVSEKDFTLTWPLGKGTDDATSPEMKTEGLFKVAAFDHGKLNVSTQRAAGTAQQTLYKPSKSNVAVNDDDVLTFTIIPKKGLTFIPKSLSFNASRWGTSGGKFDVVATAKGTETTLAAGINPEHGNSGLFSACNYDLSGIATDETGLVIKIKVYNLADNKEYGFGNIAVTGDVEGVPEAVPSYTLSIKQGTEGAGHVSSNPAGGEFDEGTLITVNATENFGYHFAGWVDAEGKTVSTESTYKFEITQHTSLTATYTQNNVYALNLQIEGGANANLVQFQPEGNVVGGIHYYEEGTDVKLTALNNRIMTFTSWDDNSTAAERIVRMDGEQSVTANFAATDFIVGWDFYSDTPKSDRAADYKADSENAGIMTLRQADGTSSTWLANGVAAGKANGRYCIRVWKPIADKWYFQCSFSSIGYESLKLSAAMGDDYNAYSVNYAQYSIDGENFTTFGTFRLPNRGWDAQEFELPAEASNQEHVYIRFMPDYNSEKTGVSDSRDGTMLADVFVLADAIASGSQKATLVSSNPAEGATGISASGSIILNFDNKVKAGQGAAMLNGEEIQPIISGKSAVFKYSGLEYATSYTFEMPAGVLLSRSDEPVESVTISFTTMERQQPAPRLYDAIVAQDGSGDYQTLQEAIDAAPEGRGLPWLIFVKNGTYKGHVDIPKTKPYMHIIGQNRDKAVITNDALSGGANAVHVSIGATVTVNSDNCFFENITLENSYGHEKQAGPQALALNTGGDRIALNKVALLSYQDTWITTSTQKNRHYIKNSLIEGAVDFIYNGGDVYLDGDTLEINRPSGGYIVAPWHTADTKWGYVFQNNVIRQHPGVNVTDVWLGRPWHGEPKTVFINTKTYVNIPAKGWYNTMGGLPVLWADYNTVDADGNPVDLSQRESYYYYTDDDTGKKMETFGVKNRLTDEEAAQYTIKNVMGGTDNWQPDLLCEPVAAPQVTQNGNTLSWEAVPYAICYVVSKGDDVVSIQTETEFQLPAAARAPQNAATAEVFCVQAVNEQGGLSPMGTVQQATAISVVETAASHAQETGAAFNLSGQRVSSSYKGVVVIGGKKIIRR